MGGVGSGPRPGGSKSLPKNKRKITIQQAANALARKGYELGPGGWSQKDGATYVVKSPGGKTSTMTVSQIKDIVYS